MSYRKSKIMMLKQKICMMQNQLIMLTQENSIDRQSRSHSKNKSTHSNQTHSRDRSIRSPTFRFSQITNQDKALKKTKQQKDLYNRQKSREQIQSRLSPKLKKIVNTVQSKYYLNTSLSADLLPPSINVIQSAKNLKGPQKGTISNCLVKQDQNKKQKIKMPNLNKTVILKNPEKQKQIATKNKQTKDKYSDNIVLKSPKQNSAQSEIKKMVFLQKKQNVDKSLILFTSAKNIESQQQYFLRPRKSQKKHFAQYFRQNLFSQIF